MYSVNVFTVIMEGNIDALNTTLIALQKQVNSIMTEDTTETIMRKVQNKDANELALYNLINDTI